MPLQSPRSTASGSQITADTAQRVQQRTILRGSTRANTSSLCTLVHDSLQMQIRVCGFECSQNVVVQNVGMFPRTKGWLRYFGP